MTAPNIHWTPLLRTLCEELTREGGNHTLLLYGSRADGTADEDSDYDIAAFGPRDSTGRDTRTIDGTFLDVFLYPESALTQPGPEWLKLRGSVVLLQRGQEADRFLQGLAAVFTQGPPPLPADEIGARTTWAWKMAARMERGDAEGHYRRAWLLTALLEDYFALRRQWFEGPKKALQWIQAHDPETAHALQAALRPDASHASIRQAVARVAGPWPGRPPTPGGNPCP
jgi:hypothetical protein